ncbi:hypothetical protein [Ruegeria arenilitoris]|uniref:hypothetical protein n=1 Tax=Ruegeria arenilitoris TaxID=1173585 RepID=UPI00147AADAE|nr:hypothetical protein [Ruegeria arenilitoris]
MAEYLLFAASSWVVMVSTNLDNLAVLLGLILVMDRRRSLLGFAMAQTLVLGLALAVATGLSQSGLPDWIGYLGVIPLGLGLLGIWRQVSGNGHESDIPKGEVASVVTLFLSLSVDTFAVMTPLLADSDAQFRLAALIGAGIASASLAGIAAWGAPHAQKLGPRAARLERVAPYIMVCVGLYILSNSPTDVL